jgi:hypothetical protein
VALLRLLGQHADHFVVADFARLGAGYFRVRDGSEHHPDGRRPQLVPATHGHGEIGTQTVLQLGHGVSLAAPQFSIGRTGRVAGPVTVRPEIGFGLVLPV